MKLEVIVEAKVEVEVVVSGTHYLSGRVGGCWVDGIGGREIKTKPAQLS